MTVIRCAEPDDYAFIPPYLDRAYGFEAGTFATTFAKGWAKENVDWDNTWVAVVDGQIASLVRVYPMFLVQAHRAVAAGGIGCVSTAQEYRGRGLMTALMNHALEAMRGEGMAVSVLWGDAHRYASFGYASVGRTVRVGVRARGLERTGVAGVAAREWHGESDMLAAVAAAYDAAPYRVARTEAEHKAVYSQPGITLLCGGEGPTFGYVVLRDLYGRVGTAEHGGAFPTVLGLARHACEARGIETVELTFPGNAALPDGVEAAASWWSVVPTAMATVLDLDRTANALEVQEHVPELRPLSPSDQARALFGTSRPGLRNLFIPQLDHV